MRDAYGPRIYDPNETDSFGVPKHPLQRGLITRSQYTNAMDRLGAWLVGAAPDSDTLAGREMSEGLRFGLETLAGSFSPSGAPATVAGRIPVEHLDDVMTKVYSKLTEKAFRPGTSPTYQLRGNTFFTHLRNDADVDEAQKYALERLMKDVAEEIPDEVVASGDPKEIAKKVYNRAYREGLTKLRRNQELRKEVDYEDSIDEMLDEGGGGSALENLPEAGMRADFKAAEELAESYSPMSGNVKERVEAEVARTTAETRASTKMSQILERILNPRQRYLLTQLDTPSKQLAQELYKLKPGQKVPQWMYERIRVDKLQAQQVARGATAPGIVTHLGAPGSGKQWEVVRTALRELKPPDLQARLGALPERLREPAREFATRSMPLGNLLRKYKKTGLTREELYDAVQRLTHAPKE